MQTKIKNLKFKNKSLGFSLIELIMVVAVMLIITSVTLLRQAKFSSDVLITNMAYEVALSIREAAVFGISSKYNASGYRVGYGVHFHPAADGGDVTSFDNFIDKSLVSVDDMEAGTDAEFNYYYDSTGQVADDITDTVEITQGQKIRKYCGRIAPSTYWKCGPADNTNLNIVFVKPDPDAHITMGVDNQKDPNQYTEARIVIESSIGDKCRTVDVTSTGQISVLPIASDDPTGCLGGMPDVSL